MTNMLRADTEEFTDKDVVAANGEEETEEETEEDLVDRDADVADPNENVTGEASNAIHTATVHIQVVSAKHQRRNVITKHLL